MNPFFILCYCIFVFFKLFKLSTSSYLVPMSVWLLKVFACFLSISLKHISFVDWYLHQVHDYLATGWRKVTVRNVIRFYFENTRGFYKYLSNSLFRYCLTSWGMFSLSSLKLENWPPCLRAPPRLDKENIFRGNSYQMEYMQEHTGRKKFMHLQIEYFVPKRKEMKWRHWVKKKLWSSGMTKRCNIHLNRILGIKGLLWKQKMGEELDVRDDF